MEARKPFISRTVTVGELIGFIITITVICFSTYIGIDKRVTILEQEYLQEKENRMDIKADLKTLIEGQKSIQISLQNKMDRK